MEPTVTRKLDFSKLNFSGRFISTEETLKDLDNDYYNVAKQRVDKYVKSSTGM